MTAAVRSSSTQMGLQVGGVEYSTLDSTGLAIPAATTATQAVQLQQVSLYPTVASAATIDIFGAAGATINVSGTTTVTGITAATAAQVGSIKTIIPSNAAGFNITASANLKVDGATSGTYLMPSGARLSLLATSTTTFELVTIFATGSWTPNQGSGLTLVGAFSSSGVWTKVGRQTSVGFQVAGATSIACAAGGIITSNLPFAGAAGAPLSMGSYVNASTSSVGIMYINGGTTSNALTTIAAITAAAAIFCSITYIS
jgi:hypothetical protein